MTPTRGHDPYHAWRFRDFRLLLAGSVLASVGNEMLTVAVGWELYERTGSPLGLGLVGLVQALPVFLLALPAGQTADRYSRKAIVMLAQVAAATCSLGLAAVSRWDLPIAGMYAWLAVAGASNAFAFPARWALLPQLVPAEVFGNAVTWRSSGWQLAAVAGPAVGGLALAAFGSAAPVYVADAVLALFVLALFARMAEPARERSSEPFSARAMLAGARFVFGQKLILGAITLDMLAVLMGGAVALLPVFAKDILHVGPRGLGLLRAAPSLGALTMAITLAHRPPFRRAGRALLLAVAGFGLATIVFGLSRNYGLSLAMLCLIGALDNISVVIRATLVQTLTPDAMRGRVSSVNSVFIGTSNELGAFESGVAARLVGPAYAVVLGGVGTLLVVLGVARRWPELARLGSLADLAGGRDEGLAVSPPDDEPRRSPSPAGRAV